MTSSLEVARSNASQIKLATSLLKERTPTPNLHETARVVKDVVRERRDPSKKLLTLGAALLIMPDPFTDMAAVPVLIAGKVMQSRASINVKNVHDEMRQTLSLLSFACSL